MIIHGHLLSLRVFDIIEWQKNLVIFFYKMGGLAGAAELYRHNAKILLIALLQVSRLD